MEKLEELYEIIVEKYGILKDKEYSTQEASEMLGLHQTKMKNGHKDVVRINSLIKTNKLKAETKTGRLLIRGENIVLYLLSKNLYQIQK